mgnify:CR=1 FL=1
MGKRHYIIVTNNPLVAANWPDEVSFVEGDPGDVYRATRDMVHRGHKLLTHPLAGSVKPNESPYRSVIVTSDSLPAVDFASLRPIEAARSALDKLVASSGLRYARGAVPPDVDSDYRLIDAELMESAVTSLNEF